MGDGTKLITFTDTMLWQLTVLHGAAAVQHPGAKTTVYGECSPPLSSSMLSACTVELEVISISRYFHDDVAVRMQKNTLRTICVTIE